MSVEDEFAENVRARHAGPFEKLTCAAHGRDFGAAAAPVGRGTTPAAEAFVRRIRKRSKNSSVRRIFEQHDDAFAERILNRFSMRSAAHIFGEAPLSGAFGFSEAPLIFLKRHPKTSTDNFVYQLLLRMNRTWQSIQVRKEKAAAAYRDALVQSIVKRMERIVKPEGGWHKQPAVQKELTVFRDIATIFVNRGSRPDLAKKAERELVKILSREYRENHPERKISEDHIYQRQITHEELVTTRRTVAGLEEQINRQKTLLLQLQKRMETAIPVPEPDIGKLTGEVMRRMEREMHLERLRRG